MSTFLVDGEAVVLYAEASSQTVLVARVLSARYPRAAGPSCYDAVY